jgi:hypothetical protein
MIKPPARLRKASRPGTIAVILCGLLGLALAILADNLIGGGLGFAAGSVISLVGGNRLGVWSGTRPPHSAGPPRVGGRAALPAARLTAIAAWLLPSGDRARYGEEWAAELWDLAAAGWWTQVRYAARLLASAPPLRLAVLAPRRKGAAP